ncbi:MAG: DUF2007 domain-containing protein [Ferruginibacter sp.]
MQTVVLKTFDNYFSANILLTRLQDAGVPCYLFDENTVTVNPIIGAVVGGIKLVVDKNDEPEARELIAGYEEEFTKSAVCPKCFKSDIQLVTKQSPENIFTAVITWLFGSYSVAKKVYQCQSCGYESENLPTKESAYN